jgi:serine/threonine protein kinase
MKKEVTKKKSTGFKPRNKKRQCLLEIPYNSIEARHPLKKRSKVVQVFDLLPSELILTIFEYLSPQEIVTSCQMVCKYWQMIVAAPLLWKRKDVQIELRWLVRCNRCLVERRSKGKVYTGFMRSTAEPVTLRKVYLDITNAGYDDGVPTSILREISFLKEINHENIAGIVKAEVVGKVVYVCTEQGEFNLKEYMKRFYVNEGYCINKGTVQNLMKQIFQGLQFIHSRGIIHRNLKPDNILLNRSGTVKLADFTLSRMESVPRYPYTPEDPKERERSGREARRLWYRAPELLLRKDLYGSEVDIWTAGCLLAELVLGCPLFNGENEIEHLFKIFKVMGVPDTVHARSFPSWKRVNFQHVTYPKDSIEYKTLLSTLVPSREQVLNILSKLSTVLGEDGMDLLQKCLETSPELRINAEDALAHPFFNVPIKKEPVLRPMLEIEKNLRPDPEYLSKQENINESMRSILVDWLIDVSVHFEVRDETLHLAVSFIDRTLSVLKVDRSKLQLVGVTCMKIADVFNERSKEYYRQENSIEYAYITADEYSPAQVVSMEKLILNCLEFRLLSPTIQSFLRRYLELTIVSSDTCALSLYLSDLLLLFIASLKHKPSVLASCVLFMACASTEFPSKVPDVLLCAEGEFSKGLEHIRECWLDVRTNPSFSRFESINLKHSNISPKTLWPPSLERRSWS